MIEAQRAELYESAEDFVARYYQVEESGPDFNDLMMSLPPLKNYHNSAHIPLRDCLSCFAELIERELVRRLPALVM